MSNDRSLHLKCSPGARRRVNALIAAAQDDAFKGSYHPDDRNAVEAKFNNTKSRFLSFIAQLEHRVSQTNKTVNPMSLGNEDRK